MPSFLIVNSQPPGGRADLFAQPPTIDVSGFGARLDWGDVTFEVPPGDHRVTVSVENAGGGREGAVLTVRVLPETGTRISFSPPATPGHPSTLRVDGQWPADAAMAYYAARDRRSLTPPELHGGAQQGAGHGGAPRAAAPAAPGQRSAAPQPSQPQPQPVQVRPVQSQPVQQQPVQQQPVQQQPVQSQPVQSQPGGTAFGQPQPPAVAGIPAFQPPAVQQQRAAQAPAPQPAVPPVGPVVGSTGSVPVTGLISSAPTFGQVQGSVVEPGAQRATGQRPPQQQAPARPPFPSAQQQPMPVSQSQRPSTMPLQQPAGQQQPATMPLQQPQPAGQVPPSGQPQVLGQPQVMGQPQPAGQAPAAFGQQVRRDAYGRDRVSGDRTAPPIPTPSEYEALTRAESERMAAEELVQQRRQQPQGWYPDPYGRSDVRWHDGERWSPSVMRAGRREHDPV